MKAASRGAPGGSLPTALTVTRYKREKTRVNSGADHLAAAKLANPVLNSIYSCASDVAASKTSKVRIIVRLFSPVPGQHIWNPLAADVAINEDGADVSLAPLTVAF